MWRIFFNSTPAAVTGRAAPAEVLALANGNHPRTGGSPAGLNQLSGGQSRALMIADIALICDSPIVLIDRLKTRASTRERALGLLQKSDKLVLVVTHIPTQPDGPAAIVLAGRAVTAVVERTPPE